MGSKEHDIVHEPLFLSLASVPLPLPSLSKNSFVPVRTACPPLPLEGVFLENCVAPEPGRTSPKTACLGVVVVTPGQISPACLGVVVVPWRSREGDQGG